MHQMSRPSCCALGLFLLFLSPATSGAQQYTEVYLHLGGTGLPPGPLNVTPTTNPVPPGTTIRELHLFSITDIHLIPANATIQRVETAISSGIFGSGVWGSMRGALSDGTSRFQLAPADQLGDPSPNEGLEVYCVGCYAYGGNTGFVTNPFTNLPWTRQDLASHQWGFWAQWTNSDLRWPVEARPISFNDYSIRVRYVVPPDLRAFLDVDGFSAADPAGTDDKAWYVPCSSNPANDSVPPAQLPQRIRVVAAYVNGSGQIVAPPTQGLAVLSLTQVSAFKGIAMNAALASRGEDTPDFEVVQNGIPFGADNTARIEVNCWDYGGFATAAVTQDGVWSAPFKIPLDDNGNWIADAGWKAGTATIADTGLGTGVDEDNDPVVGGPPAGLGLIGDGLLNFEEYRGFVVRGIEHRRTNPFKKDVFISSNLQFGISFAFPNLPLATHRINGQDETGVDEYRTSDRVVNWKYQNAGFGGSIPNRTEANGQKALRAISVPDRPGVLGFACTIAAGCSGGVPSTPNEMDHIEIYTKPHQRLRQDFNYTNLQIDNQFQRTFGHEVGHGVHVCHRTQIPTTCPDGATIGTDISMMGWEPQGSSQTDPRSQYNALDVAQIRLHIRF